MSCSLQPAGVASGVTRTPQFCGCGAQNRWLFGLREPTVPKILSPREAYCHWQRRHGDHRNGWIDGNRHRPRSSPDRQAHSASLKQPHAAAAAVAAEQPTKKERDAQPVRKGPARAVNTTVSLVFSDLPSLPHPHEIPFFEPHSPLGSVREQS